MPFKKTLVAGAAMLSGLMLMPVSNAIAAELPAQSQQAVNNAQESRVDAQIKELHDKLHITPAQEDKWKEVAESMQDTAKEVRSKLTNRAEKVKTSSLTAVDELRAYQDLQQVQYDGVKRLVGPFEKLYATMTPPQQKNADAIFEQAPEQAKATGASQRKTVVTAP